MAKETLAQKRLLGLIKKLSAIRGRHTELITIYVPAGTHLNLVSTQVNQEQGTAVNIKSKAVRKNVVGALEKISQHLKLYKRAPENGLALFCGNVSEKEGESDLELWAIEPPEKLNQRLYRCDQTFVLDPLKHMVREKEIYGLIVLDKSEADIGTLTGKRVDSLKHIESLVPGKTKKGGWCVHEDALMHLSDGRIMKISEIGEESFISYDFSRMSSSIGKHNHYFQRKSDEALLIRTKAPTLEILVTPEHKFFVPTSDGFGTKSAEELSIGERLLCLKHIPFIGSSQSIEAEVPHRLKITEGGRRLFSDKRQRLGLSQQDVARRTGVSQTFVSKFEKGERDPDNDLLEKMLDCVSLTKKEKSDAISSMAAFGWSGVMNADMARFIGYFMGDGGIEDTRITLHEGDSQLATEYSGIPQRLFGIPALPKKRKGRNYHETRIHSKYLCSVLRNVFPETFKSHERDIPDSVCRSSSEVLSSFIAGIWDAEGYATMSNRSAGITMDNRSVISKLQILLLRFGIVSSIKPVSSKGSFAKKQRHALVITDAHSLRMFSEKIRLLSKKKSKTIARIVKSIGDATYTDQVPFLGSYVLNLVHDLGMTTDDFPRVQDFFFDKKGMSYRIFAKNIVDNIRKRSDDSAKFNDVLSIMDSMKESGMISARINTIEHVKSDGTFYDMEVPKYENFMANGLIVHNSQARYARVREGLLNDHMKKAGEIATSYFRDMPDLRGIIIGGPGPIKDMFFNGDFLPTDVKAKILGVVDTSYTGTYGLEEVINRGEDILAEASVTRERKLLEHFFSELAKESGLAVYGVKETVQALERGAVEILLISEEFDWLHVIAECPSCKKKIEKIVKRDRKNEVMCPGCGSKMDIVQETDASEKLDSLAENVGTKVEIVSTDSREGVQLHEMGGIAGILRYSV